jgi:uncharacterized membrane protein YdbT with pleckstrin-like domain
MYNQVEMPDVFVSPEKVPTTEAQKQEIPGHTHKTLSAFSLYPDNVGFETKENQERIILLLRQHPVVNIPWIVVTVLMLFVPTGVRFLGILSTLPAGFDLVVTLGWYLFMMIYALEKFLSWFFNVYFVTDRRVIDVDFYNLIDKRVSDADISKIQDVSYTTAGVFGTVLDYGDVVIQTAAEVSEFDFESVPNPEKVTKILDDLKVKTKGDGV